MMDGLEGWHIVIIVVIAAVLFGSGKLPGAARSIGQSLRIFKSELRAGTQDEPGPGAGQNQSIAAPAAIDNSTVAASVLPAPTATPVPAPIPAPAPIAEPVTGQSGEQTRA